MTLKQTQLAWVRGYVRRGVGDVPGTQTADYRLSDLVQRGFIAAKDGHGLLVAAGLSDLVWGGGVFGLGAGFCGGQTPRRRPTTSLKTASSTPRATLFSCMAGQATTRSGRTSPAWW